MSNLTSRDWWKCAFTRMIKTMAQAFIATVGTAMVLSEVNWVATLSATAIAGLLSIVTSLAGLPETKTEDNN